MNALTILFVAAALAASCAGAAEETASSAAAAVAGGGSADDDDDAHLEPVVQRHAGVLTEEECKDLLGVVKEGARPRFVSSRRRRCASYPRFEFHNRSRVVLSSRISPALLLARTF